VTADPFAVDGYCPMGCGRTLFLADGVVVCSWQQCPRRDAVTDLLADKETEHVVQFGADTFTVRHPLRERLDDALMDCELHDDLAAMAGPPVRPGKYRAVREGDRWTWQGADQ
jgi:hypothetical protein